MRSGVLTGNHAISCVLFLSAVFYCFYRAMHFSAKRGIAIACRPSVRLSVCLSVCLSAVLWKLHFKCNLLQLQVP